MFLLLIDTSQLEACVILANDTKIIGQQSWPNNPDVGKETLQIIDQLLNKHGLVLPDINRFAVCSTASHHFSWLRSGVLVTALLAYSTQAELVELNCNQPEHLLSQALSTHPVDFIKPIYKSILATNH